MQGEFTSFVNLNSLLIKKVYNRINNKELKMGVKSIIQAQATNWWNNVSRPKKALDIAIVLAALALIGGGLLLGTQYNIKSHSLAKLNKFANSLKNAWFGVAGGAVAGLVLGEGVLIYRIHRHWTALARAQARSEKTEAAMKEMLDDSGRQVAQFDALDPAKDDAEWRGVMRDHGIGAATSRPVTATAEGSPKETRQQKKKRLKQTIANKRAGLPTGSQVTEADHERVKGRYGRSKRQEQLDASAGKAGNLESLAAGFAQQASRAKS